MNDQQGVRIQKILAQAGYGSRRACERYIEQGRVRVNGERVKLGDRADPSLDRIEFDAKIVVGPELEIYLMLNKPPGVLSSTVSQGGHRTIFDIVQIPERVYPVGRLDLDSEGLILLTNDGQLANRLTHPSYMHEKEYSVMLDRRLEDDDEISWSQGVLLKDGSQTNPLSLHLNPGGSPWLRVIIREGKKRQIRRTAEVLGYKVERLIRTRISTLKLGKLIQGDYRPLQEQELLQLKKAAGFSKN